MTDPSLSILLERLARIIHNDTHSQGLKPTQWEALRYIARANRFSCNPGALTAYLGMTKGTVSQTLSALEKKDLITKTANPEDKRAVNLALTSNGLDLLENDPLSVLNSGVRGTDCATIETLLESSLKALLAQRGGHPFGACKTCRHFQINSESGNPHFCGLLLEPLSTEDSKKICIEQVPA